MLLYPRQNEYKVKRGDNLWNISREMYGDPTVWPQVAADNKIPDGNFIVIGMKLRLQVVRRRHQAHSVASHLSHPKLQTHPLGPDAQVHIDHPAFEPHAQFEEVKGAVSARAMLDVDGTKHSNQPELPDARPVAFPALKKSFDLVPPISVVAPCFKLTWRLTGEVTLQFAEEPLTEVEPSKDGIKVSASVKSQYDQRFAKTVQEMKFSYDPVKQRGELSGGFETVTKINGREFSSVKFEITSPNSFKCSISPKKIEGKIGPYQFEGKMGLEAEVEKRNCPEDDPQEGRSYRTARIVAVVGGGALIVAGAAVVVADILKDVGTAGAGTVESPISFAWASAMFARGFSLIAGTGGAALQMAR